MQTVLGRLITHIVANFMLYMCAKNCDNWLIVNIVMKNKTAIFFRYRRSFCNKLFHLSFCCSWHNDSTNMLQLLYHLLHVFHVVMLVR